MTLFRYSGGSPGARLGPGIGRLGSEIGPEIVEIGPEASEKVSIRPKIDEDERPCNLAVQTAREAI